MRHKNIRTSILLVIILLVLSACKGVGQYKIADKSTDPYYRILVEKNGKKIIVPKRIIAPKSWAIEQDTALAEDTNKPLRDESLNNRNYKKDTRVNTVRKYSVYWSGLHMADMVTEIKSYDIFITNKQSGQNTIEAQKFTTIIRTFNLAKLINGFKSETKATMFLNKQRQYKPFEYSTSYSMRKKHRDITLKYSDDGSTIIKETNVPPEKRWKRKEVPAELKNNAADPLTFVFQVREKIRNVIENGGQSIFIHSLYDGRRRSDFLFTVYGVTKENLIHITFEEKPIAGYTNNELKDFKKGTTLFTVYLSESDLLPIWAEGYSFLGSAKIILKKYCKTLHECLN